MNFTVTHRCGQHLMTTNVIIDDMADAKKTFIYTTPPLHQQRMLLMFLLLTSSSRDANTSLENLISFLPIKYFTTCDATTTVPITSTTFTVLPIFTTLFLIDIHFKFLLYFIFLFHMVIRGAYVVSLIILIIYIWIIRIIGIY